jgi:Tfp pilus assembly protein PilF
MPLHTFVAWKRSSMAPDRVRGRMAAFALACFLGAVIPAAAGELEWRVFRDQTNAHFMQGNFEQSENFARQALAEARQTFGPTHPNTESSLGAVALVLRFRGQLVESEQQYRTVVAMREKRLGPDHPDTAVMLNNFADLLQARRKYEEAEQVQRRVLAIFDKAYGQDARTATSLNNLGAALQGQGKYAEAEPYLMRALVMKENVLGPRHQSVVHTLNNLAEVLTELGRDDEARSIRARIAAGQKPQP